MKFSGHIYLVDWLLQQAKVDVNCCDTNGRSLVASTVSLCLNDDTVRQLEYLVQHGADCSLKDSIGNNALHYLASTQVGHICRSSA